LAQRLRKLRNHGASSDHYHDIAGFNSRLDEIQAAVLRTKLANIDLFHRERRRLAKRYIDELEMNVMIPCLPRSDADGLDHIYHHMVICLQNRDAVRDRLAQRGVQTEIHYPVPVHLQKALADLGYKKGSFPTAEAAANDVLSLPLYFGLSDEQQDYVIKSLLKSL
jgi:dTDP-4-amino-4,6-dideoxygalactose transaminase